MSPTRECDSYHPGHNAHPIQVFRGIATLGRPVALITVTDPGYGSLIAVVRGTAPARRPGCSTTSPPSGRHRTAGSTAGPSCTTTGSLIVGSPQDASRPCLFPCLKPKEWTTCATLASVGADDPAVLTEVLGGVLVRPSHTHPAEPAYLARTRERTS